MNNVFNEEHIWISGKKSSLHCALVFYPVSITAGVFLSCLSKQKTSIHIVVECNSAPCKDDMKFVFPHFFFLNFIKPGELRNDYFLN